MSPDRVTIHSAQDVKHALFKHSIDQILLEPDESSKIVTNSNHVLPRLSVEDCFVYLLQLRIKRLYPYIYVYNATNMFTNYSARPTKTVGWIAKTQQSMNPHSLIGISTLVV